MSKVKYFFKKDEFCPFCGVENELDEEERKSGEFFCGNCNKKVCRIEKKEENVVEKKDPLYLLSKVLKKIFLNIFIFMIAGLGSYAILEKTSIGFSDILSIFFGLAAVILINIKNISKLKKYVYSISPENSFISNTFSLIVKFPKWYISTYKSHKFLTISISIIIIFTIYLIVPKGDDEFKNIRYNKNTIIVDYSIESEMFPSVTCLSIANNIYDLSKQNPDKDSMQINVYFTGGLYDSYGKEIPPPVYMGLLDFSLKDARKYELGAYYANEMENIILTKIKYTLKYGSIFKK